MDGQAGASQASVALPIRGPLRYQVETSSPQIEAGREFSVFVRITNPYDVPATVCGVATRLPAKFIDVESVKRERQKAAYLKRFQELAMDCLADQVPEVKNVAHDKDERRRQLLKTVLRLIPFGLGGLLETSYDVAQYVAASRVGPNADIAMELLTPQNLEAAVEKVRQSTKPGVALYPAVLEEIKARLQQAEEARQPAVTLQPGNSTVHAFTLNTTHAILFVPSSYNLNLQVEYEIDGKVNQDSVGYQLNVRAPLKALIWGSGVGSLVGYLVRDIFNEKVLVGLLQAPSAQQVVSWVVALLGNLLVGALLVIAFARKKDTQPILSIEDFWGGVFVGFLAGYMGKAVLNQFLLPAGPGRSASGA